MRMHEIHLWRSSSVNDLRGKKNNNKPNLGIYIRLPSPKQILIVITLDAIDPTMNARLVPNKAKSVWIKTTFPAQKLIVKKTHCWLTRISEEKQYD